jgi:hypothetical protein
LESILTLLKRLKITTQEWVATKPPDLPLGWNQLIEQAGQQVLAKIKFP